MRLDLRKFKPKKPKDTGINLESISDFEALLAIHNGETAAEHKHDGNGIIIDKRRGTPRLFSLRKTEWDIQCFPELVDDLHAIPNGFYMGEILGKATHPGFSSKEEFKAISIRPATAPTEATKKLAETHPLEIRIYDVLRYGSKLTALWPNEISRSLLEDKIDYGSISIPERRLITDPEELQTWAKEHIGNGMEGFVIKDPRQPYAKQADHITGARNKHWLKIKRNINLDLVVLGLYQTKDQLRNGFACSNVLLGALNEETRKFETVTKLTLAGRDLAQQIYELVAPHSNYSWSQSTPYFWQNDDNPYYSAEVVYSEQMQQGKPRGKVPFMYVKSPQRDAIVIETNAMEITCPYSSIHTCGLTYGQVHSLRIPTFGRLRHDKGPLDATTTQQIRELAQK